MIKYFNNKEKFVEFEGLTFDDILLLPNYSDFKRKDVELTTHLHPKLVLKLPIISSPMDTVTEASMAEAMARAGALGIIHRNLSINKQIKEVERVKKQKLLVGAAVGVGQDFNQRTQALVKARVDVIVIDSAHGHSKPVIEAVIYLKKHFPKTIVMAGNIATYAGAMSLIRAGADILRVGMGPGSICTTRIITGMGVPQISAILEVARAAKNSSVTLVADGGIRQIGDIAKALACGASAVMLGSLLARFDESPGKIVMVSGKKYKQYRGMGSIAAMKKGAAERYGQLAKKPNNKLIAEGVEGLVPYMGKVADYLYQIEGSLRSSFYYLGARSTEEFYQKSKFIKVSRAGILESHPHTVVISKPGQNYNY